LKGKGEVESMEAAACPSKTAGTNSPRYMNHKLGGFRLMKSLIK
jgi:hypothetical protein